MSKAHQFPFYTPIDEILFNKRLVHVSGPVGGEMAYEVNRKLLALAALDSKTPITLLINSPGGEINSGFSIFDTAQMIEPTVTTLVCGLAASMGSLIALCADKKNRLATPNSKFLIHQPLISGTIQGSASELEIHANDIIATRKRINELYAKETGQPLAKVSEATDRDHWLTAEEALKFGLITKIVNSFAEVWK
ncbi:MAG: ATP-dependent Clp protease proteolytic subunit [Bdellovibrionales bacterium]|nr:ATP-dependent Clp protease proteolytic subunit [Bdellovibrionales bacterium]